MVEIEQKFNLDQEKIGYFSGTLEHLDFRFKKFRKLTEKDMRDASVQMQDDGFYQYPVKIKFEKLYEEKEPPAELLWMIKLDEKIYQGISNVFHSPFRPAPILKSLQMEFNVLYIDKFNAFYDRMIDET